MKRVLISIVILFLSKILNGQELPSSKNKTWTMGAFVMPSIIVNHKYGREVNYSNIIGIRIEKELNNRLAFSTSVNYYKTELYHGTYWGGICGTPKGTCSWYSETDYLEIPINLKIYYSQTKSRVNSYLIIGTCTNFSSKNINTEIYLDEDSYTKTIYKNVKLTYQQNYLFASFGTEFNLSSKLNVCIEPQFRYSFQSLIHHSDFTNYTILMGFGTGIQYKF